MRACASVPREDQGTWIGPEIIRAYTRLHNEGDAHSLEVWEGNELVGGLYGVDAGGVFTGESMFHVRPDASKLALLHLIEHLRSRGATWLDCQIMTPHMRALGAREIPISTPSSSCPRLMCAMIADCSHCGERASRPHSASVSLVELHL